MDLSSASNGYPQQHSPLPIGVKGHSPGAGPPPSRPNLRVVIPPTRDGVCTFGSRLLAIHSLTLIFYYANLTGFFKELNSIENKN